MFSKIKANRIIAAILAKIFSRVEWRQNDTECTKYNRDQKDVHFLSKCKTCNFSYKICNKNYPLNFSNIAFQFFGT